MAKLENFNARELAAIARGEGRYDVSVLPIAAEAWDVSGLLADLPIAAEAWNVSGLLADLKRETGEEPGEIGPIPALGVVCFGNVSARFVTALADHPGVKVVEQAHLARAFGL